MLYHLILWFLSSVLIIILYSYVYTFWSTLLDSVFEGKTTVFLVSSVSMGFPGDSAGKEFACNSPWIGKIPWRREQLPTPIFWPGEFHGLYSPWGHKESHNWATFTFMHEMRFPGGSICLQCRRPGFDPWVGKIPRRREWQPTPVFLPGEFHGQRSLAGYSPWGHKDSDTTEQLTLTFQALEMITILIVPVWQIKTLRCDKAK